MAKTPIELANRMLDLDKRSLDITPQVESFFAKYPKNENESYEDYDGRVYSDYANEFGYLERGALNDIYERALKKAYFGSDIDSDYERSWGPVDTDEKYQEYLEWKKEGN